MAVWFQYLAFLSPNVDIRVPPPEFLEAVVAALSNQALRCFFRVQDASYPVLQRSDSLLIGLL